MTGPMEITFIRRVSIRYDGTNGEAVRAAAATCGSPALTWTIDSDDGSELRLRITQPSGLFYVYVIPQWMWVVVFGEDGNIQLHTDERFQYNYCNVDDIATALIATPFFVSALPAGPTGATGPVGPAGPAGPAGPSSGATLDGKSVAVSVVTLGAGATVDLPAMTWNGNLGRTDYRVIFYPDNALIGRLNFAVKAGATKTATGMVIQVTAISAITLSLAGVVHCQAVTP